MERLHPPVSDRLCDEQLQSTHVRSRFCDWRVQRIQKRGEGQPEEVQILHPVSCTGNKNKPQICTPVFNSFYVSLCFLLLLKGGSKGMLTFQVLPELHDLLP